jgi:hypothetical protein
MVNIAASYQDTADRAGREAWVAGVAAALHQNDTGAYVNFIGDEGQERVRAAYPGSTWDRLVAIKTRYDPTNLFRLNQNIPPLIEDTQEPRPGDGTRRSVAHGGPRHRPTDVSNAAAHPDAARG